ncbi:MAG: NAD(P)H-dependent oxidoreductase [Phycisphaeraceae bacterium]
MRIVVISCSLDPASRSRVLAEAAVEELSSQGVEVKFVDLREIDLPMCDGDSAFAAASSRQMAREVADASAIVLAVPIYNYDVNAAAKNLIELTGRVWQDKVVGFLCAAGGQGSYMSIMGLANSLMLDFRCLIIPRFVYATGEAFVDEKLASEKVLERLRDLCGRLVQIAGALETTKI